MKQKTKKNLIKSIIFIFIFALLLVNVMEIFRYKFENADSASVKHQISEYSKEDIDILYMGPSKLMYDLSPIVIWDKINVSGFNLATAEQFPLVSYYLLKDALDHVKPKILFIEFRYISETSDPKERPLSLAYYFGHYLIQNKEYKKQYFDELKSYYPDNDYKEYYFPFLRDHARWNSLNKDDFIEKTFPNYFLGGAIKDVANPYIIDKKLYESKAEIIFDEKSMEVYKRLIDLAKENDIKVIAINPPSAITTKKGYIASETAKKFAEKNGIDFYDFNSPDLMETIGLNPNEDYEISAHLNVNGNYKFSVKMAELISTLDFEPYKKSEAFIEKWNLMYQNYLEDIKRYKVYKLNL